MRLLSWQTFRVTYKGRRRRLHQILLALFSALGLVVLLYGAQEPSAVLVLVGLVPGLIGGLWLGVTLLSVVGRWATRAVGGQRASAVINWLRWLGRYSFPFAAPWMVWWCALAVGLYGYEKILPRIRPDSDSGLDTFREARHLLNAGSSKETAVVLVFSGGGSRSAIFATSVLELLHDQEYFRLPDGSALGDRVSHLIGVSGGAVAAASYIFWKGTAGQGESSDVRGFFKLQRRRIASDFTTPQAAFLALFWPELVLAKTSRLDALTWSWAATGAVPRTATIGVLRRLEEDERSRVPKLVVVTADPAESAVVMLTTREVVKWPSVSARLGDGHVGELIAASSAIPPIYPAYRMEAGRSQRKTPLYLLDGGLVDNLGLETALSLFWDLSQKIVFCDPPWECPGGVIEPRKVLLIFVDSTAILKEEQGAQYIMPFSLAWRALRVMTTLRGQRESILQATGQPQRFKSCLGAVYIAPPLDARDIATSWSLSEKEVERLSVYRLGKSFLEDVAAAVREFMDWEMGSPFLTRAHVQAGTDYRLPSREEWRDQCGPGDIYDYVDSVERLIGRVAVRTFATVPRVNQLGMVRTWHPIMGRHLDREIVTRLEAEALGSGRSVAFVMSCIDGTKEWPIVRVAIPPSVEGTNVLSAAVERLRPLARDAKAIEYARSQLSRCGAIIRGRG